MKQQKRKRFDLSFLKTLSFWSSVGLSLVVLTIYLLSRPEIKLLPAVDILEIMEVKSLDLRFHLRGEIEPRCDIVIIAVDEKTEDELGRWQSSGRQWLAKLLDILHEGNAKVIGFDFVLAEPDEGRDLKMIAELRKHLADEISNYPDVLTYLEQAAVSHNYDLQLTEAIQRAGNVVLGLYHFEDVASAAHLPPEKHEAYQQLIQRVAYTSIQFPSDITPAPLRLPPSFGVEPNLPAFSDAAKSFGHFDTFSDRDGYIRFTPLLMEFEGEYYPLLTILSFQQGFHRHSDQNSRNTGDPDHYLFRLGS